MNTPVAVGLDFGGTKIAAALSDVDGRRLAQGSVSTVPAAGAISNFELGMSCARDLLASVDHPRVVAVGAATFGIPGTNGVELAPAIPGWDDLRLELELARAFPEAQVAVATDVKAAAFAEATDGALAGCDPGIYLNLGTGLAVAIVASGTVIAGRNGASGEIGYNLRTVADVGRSATERLILEDAVSGMGLSRSAGTVDSRPRTATEVFAAALHDTGAAALVADFTTELAFHLVNLAIAVDPARIVVGGGMTAQWHQFHSGLRKALDAAVPYPPELMMARFPLDAPLRGALLIARAALRGSEVGAAAAREP